MTDRESVVTVCAKGGLETFLRTVEAYPSRYSQVVICSPFLDDVLCERVVQFAVTAHTVGCGVRLITGNGAVPYSARSAGKDGRSVRSFLAIPRLHAKVYLALARDRRSSMAIVTSANLTEAGLNKNIELGLLILATSPQGARIVEEVRRFLELVVTKER